MDLMQHMLIGLVLGICVLYLVFLTIEYKTISDMQKKLEDHIQSSKDELEKRGVKIDE